MQTPEDSHGPLVGRERERFALDRILGRLTAAFAPAGAAQVVAVTGEPGIGKSRLLAELGRLAARRGLAVAAGRAPEPSRRVPFGAWIDALDDHLAGLDRGRLTSLCAEYLGLLAGVFPALAGFPELAGVADPGGRFRRYRAVRALLERVGRSGLVLILDDLHRADDESVELLAHLLRRPLRAPVLVAFAYRPRQAGGRLRAAVAAGAERLDLGPLSERDVDALLGPCDDRSRRRALYAECGGNPFYLEARVRSAQGCAASDGQRSGGPLPPGVEAALVAEADALSDCARLLARAAAVAGDGFEVCLAADIAEVSESGALLAVDELVDRDLIRPLADARRFAFRHPMVRRVIYDSTPPGWRLAAHSRAATVLERRGGSVVDRAHHLVLVARPGDLAAVSVLADAARAVGQNAPDVAVRWQRAALDLLPDTPGALPRRVMLLFDLAVCLGATGCPRESRDTLREVLRLLPGDKAGLRANATAFCTRMERQLCHREPGHALLVEAVAALPDRDSVEAATVKFELACCELLDGRPVPARDLAEQSLAAAARAGARPLRAAALGVLAIAHFFTGDAPAAQERLARGTALLDGMLDGELTARLDGAAWVGWGEFFLDRLPDALRHLDRALELARAGGRSRLIPDLLLSRAVALRAAGRLREAFVAAGEAAELSSSTEPRALAFAVQSWIAVARGEPDLAARAEAAAVEHRDAAARGWLAMYATRTLAEARLAVRDWRGCLAAEAAGGPERCATDPWSRVDWYEALTRAELAAGRVPAALAWAARAEKAAAAAGTRRTGAVALLARAQADDARRPGSGLEPATAARDAFRSLGMVLDMARAQVVAGLALAARGEVDSAAAELTAAQAAFEACGAALFARQTAAERRRIAGRAAHPARDPAGRSDSGRMAALTRRERQIAALVTEGLTNRLIAQRLSVTEKTVEMHLSNVFTKLAISSRTALASAVIRSAAPAV